jgi:thiol-disulfide isomerase/thioredoxin
MSKTKNFLLGSAVGTLVTLAILQLWGTSLQRTVYAAAQPQLLRPLVSLPGAKAHPTFAAPWLPAKSSEPHDSWKMRNLDGKSVSLNQFKGKVVLLNFWMTTCAPCINEMPELERLAQSLAGQNAVVLTVATDSKQQVQQFLGRKPLNVPVYLSGDDIPADFQVTGYPTTVILDKKGTAVFRHFGQATWNDPSVQDYMRRLAAN